MTREEAILLSAYTGFLLVQDFSDVHKFCEDTLGHPIWTHEFADKDVQKEIQDKLRPQIMKLIQSTNALRPVSREQVEKVCKGEWIVQQDEHKEYIKKCSKCGCPISGWWGRDRFCANCGSPMTDEGVDMVMERMETVYGQASD